MPETGEKPEVSVTPEPTVTPEVSITPEPTITPEASVTPEPTVTPDADKDNIFEQEDQNCLLYTFEIHEIELKENLIDQLVVNKEDI